MTRSGLTVEAENLLGLREKILALVPRAQAARIETDLEALLHLPFAAAGHELREERTGLEQTQHLDAGFGGGRRRQLAPDAPQDRVALEIVGRLSCTPFLTPSERLSGRHSNAA
jgi:hypothetical protein